MRQRQAIKRRCAAIALISAMAWTGLAAAATPQPFPTQNIFLVCSYPPGGGLDFIARYLAEKLRVYAGRTVIVENKVGAGGTIAARHVAQSKPDGHTILIHAGSGLAVAMNFYKNPSLDAAKDLQIVAMINRSPFVVVVNADSPYRTLKDLVAALKDKGDKASYAQNTTFGRTIGELLKLETGTSAVDIPYRGTPDILNELGRVDFAVIDSISAVVQAQKGGLRIVGVATDERMSSMADIPTLKEQGVPVVIENWLTAAVPSATPRPVVDLLNTWINEIVASDETRQVLARFGNDPIVKSPDEGQAQLLKEIDEWAGYLKAAKIPQQ